jgi:hypothetical protein
MALGIGVVTANGSPTVRMNDAAMSVASYVTGRVLVSLSMTLTFSVDWYCFGRPGRRLLRHSDFRRLGGPECSCRAFTFESFFGKIGQ